MSNRGDVFASRNSLPGDSVAWGRQVEDRVRLAERDLGKLETRVLMQNQAASAQFQKLAGQSLSLQNQADELGAQAQTLQEQVADLSGRLAYYSDDPTFSIGWGGVQTATNVQMVPPLTITLTESRVVEMSFVFQCNASASTTAANVLGLVNLIPGFGVDTSTLSSLPGGGVSVRTNASGGAGSPAGLYSSYVAPVTTRLVMPLGAGSHTFYAGLKSVNLFSQPGSNAGLLIQGPQLFVNVMQPV